MTSTWRIPQVTPDQLQRILAQAAPRQTRTPMVNQPLTQSTLASLDKAAERLTSLLKWAESLQPDVTNDVSLNDPLETIGGHDGKTSLQELQGLGKKIMDGLRAELDKEGLGGFAAHLFADANAPNVFAQAFIGAVRGADPGSPWYRNGAVVGKTAPNTPFDDVLPGAHFSGRDVEGAQEALSVPGLEAFKGPDILSFKSTADAKAGILSFDPSDNAVGKAIGEAVGKAVETIKQLPDIVKALPENIAHGIDALFHLVTPNVHEREQLETLEPGAQETKSYESPDGPVIPREQVNFDPQKTLNSVQQPGSEGRVDMSMYIDRFIHGVVAGLMSKINPNPDGPVVGAGESTGQPGKLGGILGGDPSSGDPVVVPTTAKGPKPMGVGGPGGPIPGITTPGGPLRG